MAKLLYRLGRAAGRRAWAVIICWIVVLGAAGGAYLAFGGSLSSSFTIPDTPTQQVTDDMADSLPDLTGGSAMVVLKSDSGSFNDEQKAAISDLTTQLGGADGVVAAIDPFSTEDQRAQQRAQLEAGQAQLAPAQAQIDSGRAQLDAAQQQLTAAEEQARAAGAYDAGAAQFATQQAQLDAQSAQLDAAQTQLTPQQDQVNAGLSLLDLASNVRTVSEDGSAAIISISLEDQSYNMDAGQKTALRDMVTNTSIDGVHITYNTGLADELAGLGGMEVVGVGVALIVLIVLMRALLPALAPLISSLLGVAVAVAGSMAFSGSVSMSSVTPMLGLMIGLAVGIDYSLFILNRHRKQLLSGEPINESIGLAVGTAGNAVVFAGSTVIIALLALNVTGIPFLGVMGDVAAAAVLVAVLVAITFTPALLGLMGMRVLNKKMRASAGSGQHAAPVLRPMRTRNAVIRAVLAIALLVVVALPATTMRLGMPDGSSEPSDSPQYDAFHMIQDNFGAGMNGPLLVVATLPQGIDEDQAVVTEAQIGEHLASHDSVSAVAPAAVSDDGTVIAFQVIPTEGPNADSTETLVHNLRDASPITIDSVDGDVEIGVAGTASASIDISEKLDDALVPYLIVVVGLSLLILLAVFRSILVPIIATGGFVLSLFAAFGATTAVYQWGWLSGLFGVHDPGPLLSFAPIIIMGVLFGLAMDYQLFLVSGMREAYQHGVPARIAVKSGVRIAAPVVTAAAIIMISVFAGFIFSPMVMIRPLGFGLAFGVLFDAFAVRLYIMPALMHLLGKSAWWLPKWLDRILPNVDVEGASLERTRNVLVADSQHETRD